VYCGEAGEYCGELGEYCGDDGEYCGDAGEIPWPGIVRDGDAGE